MSVDNSSHKKELSSQNAESAELIVELYSEEIPWRMQEPMAQNLAKLLQVELISALGLPKVDNDSENVFGKLHLYWTPRRVAVAFASVPKKSRAWVEQSKGPRVASPQVAIDGFLRKNNLSSIDKCIKVEDAKGEYYALEVEHLAVATSKVLGEVIATVINKMQKELKVSMRFAHQSFRWVRPLRHILVVFDGTGVKGSIDLVTELGNELDTTEKLNFTAKTRGHPFGSAEPLTVASITEYESKLRANHVEPIYEQRLAIIKKAVGEVIEFLNNSQQVVIEENACLSECPAVLTGHFDEKFLPILPLILIEVVLNQHQKIIYNAQTPEARRDFYFVANISPTTDTDTVIGGVERVVCARLEDAKFMLERDKKIPIAEHIKKLEHITFHPKLGSIADKNERVKKLVPIIIKELKQYNSDFIIKEKHDQAWFSRLVDIKKSDLATETVREFPELQGRIIINSKYLENFDSSYAIDEYLNNTFSKTEENLVIRLADTIDSLVSLWIAGERATGSGDPFFLRRYALDILDYAVSGWGGYFLSLSAIFAEANEIIYNQRILKNKNLEKQNIAINLVYFIFDRMRQQISHYDKDIRVDCIEAILDERSMIEDCNILEILNRARILQKEMAKSNHLAEIFRRLHAIINSLPGVEYIVCNEKLFEKSEERTLYALAKDIIMEGKVWDDLSYKQKLEKLADLKGVIDAFFDKVMVNVEDKAIRENRVKLLQGIYQRFAQLANFDKIQHKDLQQQSRIKQAN